MIAPLSVRTLNSAIPVVSGSSFLVSCQWNDWKFFKGFTPHDSRAHVNQGSFIHEVGATVEYVLDAIPTMDETSHILNFLAQGYCLDSKIKEQDC